MKFNLADYVGMHGVGWKKPVDVQVSQHKSTTHVRSIPTKRERHMIMMSLPRHNDHSVMSQLYKRNPA